MTRDEPKEGLMYSVYTCLTGSVFSALVAVQTWERRSVRCEAEPPLHHTKTCHS